MATTTAPPAVQLRTSPLSAIVPIDGFNPRTSIDDAELRALSASMLERGCIVPVRVQALGDGTYRLVDGEKRYKAAAMASLMELPASVRAVDASDVDVAELEGELLVDAVVANQLRSQLTAVEEALACRRLKTEYGLTLKGIAQRLQMTQARVRDRLQILQLPEALWPRVSAGEIPVGAIAGLVALEKIAPGLAECAVTLVLDRGDVYDAEPFTWRDVTEDALRSSPAACTTRRSTRRPASSSPATATRSAHSRWTTSTRRPPRSSLSCSASPSTSSSCTSTARWSSRPARSRRRTPRRTAGWGSAIIGAKSNA